MIRFALILAALLLAGTPAVLGLLENSSFTRETPVRFDERSSIDEAPERQRPDPQVDEGKGGKEDRDSRLTEHGLAHNGR
jgi:hypothetical protein